MLRTTLPRFKKASPASSSRSDLEGLVKDSSDKVRHFFFAYLALIAYVLAVVFATTDKQLLLVNEGLKLPIVDFTVPLIGFYVVIPLFVLGLHFNLLQNLASHHFKLMELQRAWKGKVPSERINASMFDFAVLEQNSVMLHWVRATNSLLCIYSGPIVLSAVLWRFADYQSSWILFEHGFLIWIDLYFVALIQSAFRKNKKPNSKNSLSNKYIHASNFFELLINFILAPILSIPRSGWSLMWIPVLFLFMFKIAICWNIFIKNDNFQPLNLYSISTLYTKLAGNFKIPEDWLIPKISIDVTEVLFTPDVKQLEANAGLTGEKDWRAYFEKNGISLDLRNRSLRYLSIPNQTLPRVLASQAQLQNANFRKTQLQGADFVEAQLHNANFDAANLQSTDFRLAKLQNASFTWTKMQGASFLSAELQGASFYNAQMQASYFGYAHLQGANLNSAQIQGANLEFAQLQGSKLNSTQFQATDLLGVQLSGTELMETNFWGVRDFMSWQIPIIFRIDDYHKNKLPFVFNKPSDKDIEKWRSEVASDSVKKVFDEKFKKTTLPSLNIGYKFVINDNLLIEELINTYCIKNYYKNPVTIFEAILKNLPDSQYRALADALKIKSQCSSIYSDLKTISHLKLK